MSKTTKKRKPRKQRAKGVGDIVEEVLEKTGAAKVAKFILGEDCGCEDRKEKLNELFRTTKKPDCLQTIESKTLNRPVKYYVFPYKDGVPIITLHDDEWRIMSDKVTHKRVIGEIINKITENL